jgi:hypothetical protein
MFELVLFCDELPVKLLAVEMDFIFAGNAFRLPSARVQPQSCGSSVLAFAASGAPLRIDLGPPRLFRQVKGAGRKWHPQKQDEFA